MDYSRFRRSKDVEDRRGDKPMSDELAEALQLLSPVYGEHNLATLAPLPMPQPGPLSFEAGLGQLDPKLLAAILKGAYERLPR